MENEELYRGSTLNTPLEDMELVCIICGEPFIWTAGEQYYFKKRYLEAPKRCPNCRASARRWRKVNGLDIDDLETRTRMEKHSDYEHRTS